MTEAAARFIRFCGSDGDDRLRVACHALGAGSGLAANDANSGEFGHALGDGQEFRHRPERLPSEIHIEASADHAHSSVREFVADIDNRVVEELDFIDSDDSRVVLDEI